MGKGCETHDGTMPAACRHGLFWPASGCAVRGRPPHPPTRACAHLLAKNMSHSASTPGAAAGQTLCPSSGGPKALPRPTTLLVSPEGRRRLTVMLPHTGGAVLRSYSSGGRGRSGRAGERCPAVSLARCCQPPRPSIKKNPNACNTEPNLSSNPSQAASSHTYPRVRVYAHACATRRRRLGQGGAERHHV